MRVAKRIYQQVPFMQWRIKSPLFKETPHLYRAVHGARPRHNLIGARKATPLKNMSLWKYHVSRVSSRCLIIVIISYPWAAWEQGCFLASQQYPNDSLLLPVQLSQMWKNPMSQNPVVALTRGSVLRCIGQYKQKRYTLKGNRNCQLNTKRNFVTEWHIDCEIVSQNKCWKQNHLEHLGADEQNPLEIQGAHHALAELKTAFLFLLSGTIIYYFVQEISQ